MLKKNCLSYTAILEDLVVQPTPNCVDRTSIDSMPHDSMIRCNFWYNTVADSTN